MSDFIKAVKNGDLEKVKSLLLVINPSRNDNKAIRYASSNGHAEVVKLLLADPRVDPSVYDNYSIRYASLNDHVEVVKLLLADPRVDPSVNDNYAIQSASRNGHIEVVKLLLSDPRVDPSLYDNESIRCTSSNGHTEIVKLLLADARVDPSAVLNYSIRSASLNGHVEVIKALLNDPRVNPSIDDNWAIRSASINGNVEIVKLLLSDSRVEWRGIDKKMKIRLLNEEDVKLKDELKTSLLLINRMTPKMKTEGEYKNLIPKSVRKNIIYRAQYEDKIKGEIPPIKLVALANLLKIQYSNNISWKELCGKVKFKLLEML